MLKQVTLRGSIKAASAFLRNTTIRNIAVNQQRSLSSASNGFKSIFLAASHANHNRNSCVVGSNIGLNKFVQLYSTSSQQKQQQNQKQHEEAAWNVKPHLNLKYIRDNTKAVIENVKKRNAEGLVDVNKILALYEQYLQTNEEIIKIRHQRNVLTDAMKTLKAAQKKLPPAEVEAQKQKEQELIAQGKELRDRLAALEPESTRLYDELTKEGLKLPNDTHPDVPVGNKGEEDAVLLRTVGEKKVTDNHTVYRDHIDLALNLNLVDFDNASLVTGAKFYYLKNELALMELALINYAMQKLYAKGFTPLIPPDLARRQVVEACGFQPRGEHSQVYHIEDTELCLAGTSEITIAGLSANKLMDLKSLPIRYAGFSHCFRKEAGSYGAKQKGLYRVHQFSKVEMFVLTTPDKSNDTLWELVDIEEEIFKSLGLHYRVLDMPASDLGAPAYRKIDIEAWMPGRNEYGEVSSASNCTDYQSRRLFARYRDAHNEPQYVHTLNATALAVPRTLIAIMETHQHPDGSIVVPETLRPFMGGIAKIEKKPAYF